MAFSSIRNVEWQSESVRRIRDRLTKELDRAFWEIEDAMQACRCPESLPLTTLCLFEKGAGDLFPQRIVACAYCSPMAGNRNYRLIKKAVSS